MRTVALIGAALGVLGDSNAHQLRALSLRPLPAVKTTSTTRSATAANSNEYVTIPVELYCPDNFISTDTGCYRETTEQAVVGCPQNYEFDVESGLCFYYEIITAVSVCPSGYFPADSGKCNKISTAAKTMVCPDGYSASATTCQKTVTGSVPLDGLECPDGFVVDFNGRCAGILAAAPRSVCPTSFSETSAGTCQLIETVNVSTVCMAGYDPYEGYCMLLKSANPELKCLDGGVIGLNQQATTCTRQELANKLYYCPLQWVYDGMKTCTCFERSCSDYAAAKTLLENEAKAKAAQAAQEVAAGGSQTAGGTLAATTSTTTTPYIRGSSGAVIYTQPTTSTANATATITVTKKKN
eukprot:GDKJ01051262.1.p1 GENE.GDKJ01051262.1~~GDKJ01051262.1.p1  ORF type:complete len:354 (-),score=53.41 GDKJ01051262.1:215-1276(-)